MRSISAIRPARLRRLQTTPWHSAFAVGLSISLVACGSPQNVPTLTPAALAASSGSARIEPNVPSVAIDLGASAAPRETAAPSQNADPIFRAMINAITAHRPTYRFRFTPDRLDGDWRLEAEADDGTGPGRLFVDLTMKAGNLTANPCTDTDYVQGGRCVLRFLANGDRLARRGLVEANGTQTVVVALIHPDRSGITAEASNIRILGRAVQVSRTDPPYSVNDLAELVIAIDDALRDQAGG
jgi:hypothetical protein